VIEKNTIGAVDKVAIALLLKDRIELGARFAAEIEYLVNDPVELPGLVRVAGPFTVDSLSPHRVLPADEDDPMLLAALSEGQDAPHRLATREDAGNTSDDFVRVVLDNLSTHSPGALYEAFPAPEAHRILRRLEFHYTPKHASWLNMVEIEIGVLRSQCLDRRIDNRQILEAEIAEWERQRNAARARIKWMFTTQRARIKLLRAYPDPDKES